jgi:cytochrome c peroxidase
MKPFAFVFALSLAFSSAIAACEQKRSDSAPAASSVPASSPPLSPPPSAAAPETSPDGLPRFKPENLVAFARIPDAVENPVIDDATRLGAKLFADKRLSRGGDVACASCHDLKTGGVDGAVFSTGTRKQHPKRNTPTVLNAAGSFAQGWDARTSTIEEYVPSHLEDAAIMEMSDDKALATAVSAIPGYGVVFQKAFPEEEPAITADTIGRALGAFTKKLFARARFDRYIAGDKGAVTDAELVGLATFVESGCTSCHQGKYLGATQTQKLGIAKPWPPPAGTDLGRFEVTKQEPDRGMFKVPTLRNVTRTAPYLHDGSVASLAETVRLMARYQVGREIGDAQVAAIVAFLGALEGDPPKELVALVRQ